MNDSSIGRFEAKEEKSKAHRIINADPHTNILTIVDHCRGDELDWVGVMSRLVCNFVRILLLFRCCFEQRGLNPVKYFVRFRNMSKQA